jgi:hypothetical protein
MATSASKILKQIISHKTDGHCAYCGVTLEPHPNFAEQRSLQDFDYSPTWSIDHLTPVSRGGTDDLDNLMPTCKACNASKHNKTLDEYRQWVLSGAIKKLDRVREHVINAKFYIDDEKIQGVLSLIETLRLELLESNPKFYMDTIQATT